MNSLQLVFRKYKQSSVFSKKRDWTPFVALAAFYLLAGAIAPPVERLMGLWS
ncbi:hypothetical protein DM44_4817 [Burkholderia cepacia]|jgi:hypothetical protein|uniref:hypothetical protein n=1 Tax=Burkholderia cenocepacia TaxID=95486 RepID=UPI0004F8F030|nr:hypothetical protein [Burkholderia cenocepacia]AIO43997.1 hypothetical protein DM42_4044 [Burkholderia cepacia]KGC02797.1 hypothetical protein DM44_4817 [Burkholderia cepacia]MDN7662704.1 hypothetical protein [Burkholderia cenocepacia]